MKKGLSDRDRLWRYLRFVKPAFETFVKPTAKHADVVRIFRALLDRFPSPYLCLLETR
jgi:uridine kinase